MTMEVSRTKLAQTALDAYISAEGADRRLEDGVPSYAIVDLITDLLLLAHQRSHDPLSIIRKAERHLLAEAAVRERTQPVSASGPVEDQGMHFERDTHGDWVIDPGQLASRLGTDPGHLRHEMRLGFV